MHSDDTPYTLGDSHAGVLAGIAWCLRLGEDARAYGAAADAVSGWSVGQHVEHLWISDRGVAKWIALVAGGTAHPGEPRAPSRAGVAVLASGTIPRGRAAAPERTLPGGATPEEVVAGLTAVRQRITSLAPALPALERATPTLSHPLLGHFTAADWMRFLHVHHRHHEAIVRDVLETAGIDAPAPPGP